ncbi:MULTISPECIES: helix-turn-helix domain-containing protein [Bacillus amyloliquefaciens group]|uniref:helix-turn-helix domain-containing protein n=1 Tax=Bacillus amyloliquefaciens group TaxID=1938374 RepID=UPI00077D8177|nr:MULTISPECIES: helix-turn-helix transcriptional regulator [Bacillus amyloliquefaciens group]AMQ71859.1 transcriptional regulator [Bacillus amyloliquefaciens UMAF6614]MBF6667018.1 helix-turn-helix transcriptional regulator [Bacillus velezensis]
MNDETLGQAVKRLRKEHNKTLEEAAKGIGITYSYLSKIERNAQQPSVKTIEKIADFFGVHKSVLFFDDESWDNYSEAEKKILSSPTISIEDLKKMNIVDKKGEKVTTEELELLISYLDDLRALKEKHLKR